MKYIFGNWKQNGDLQRLREMVVALTSLKISQERVVAIFPPFVYLETAHQLLNRTPIQLGAQNLSAAEKGAFTGEISGAMLKKVGCTFVLIGHSERRHIFGESDAVVAQKFLQALHAHLIPVLCVGETLAEFEAGQAEAVIKRQLEIIPQGSSPYLIAYEPVWAIGTGKTAAPAYAEKIHHFIQQCLTNRTPILYGGSVNAENASTLLDSPHIDGVLVGGASLIPPEFVKIVMT